MRKISLYVFVFGFLSNIEAQSVADLIKVEEVSRIEKTLASDAMQGRKTFTPGIEKASAFIESEFKKAHLKPFTGLTNYRQEFFMTESVLKSSKVFIDGNEVNNSKLAIFSYQPKVSLTEKSDVTIVKINKGDNLGQKFNQYVNSDKNYLVLVDASFSKALLRFQHIERIKANPGNNTVVFVFGISQANSFRIELTQAISKKALNNVVGILPGKSKAGEYVVFSAHYDHLGIESEQDRSASDSIYNGANDDAAGCTAVIMLAKYFAKLNNNERTLVFTTFAAEEMGGFGSKYFSQHIAADKVVAMFNLEMIGTKSKWGENSAYITGFEKSNFGEILQKNVQKSNFKFFPDPYPQEQLFYRSDNATLAKLGVPAHTISTAKMDSELLYHSIDDEFESLDIDNMSNIIRAVALSASSIISGKDTPSRVAEEVAR